MPTINSVYAKQGKELGIKVNKTFMVPLTNIFIEEGFNIRDLSQEHIDSISQAYLDGIPVPAIVVQTVGDRFKVVDGAHRYNAAIKAGVTRLECKDFSGGAEELITLMVTSSQGRNLLPMERATAYARLKNLGLTNEEIGKKVNRTRVDVDNHLILLSAPLEVQDAVKTGSIAYTTVVSETRNNGAKGEEKLVKAVAKAKSEGARKVVINTFTKGDYKEVLEILSGEPESDWSELLTTLIEKYKFCKG